MTEKTQILENLYRIESEINEACVKFDRERKEIQLLPVSKNRTNEEILVLYEKGYKEFGENRVQELLSKQNTLPDDIDWHLIGSLQTNKVKQISGKVKLIHSLDRQSLLLELDKRALAEGILVECLVEINISGEQSKSGLLPEETENFLISASAFNNLNISGLMTIGPNTEDKNAVRTAFSRMQSIFIDISFKKMHNVNMKYLSMGMSGDYVDALEFGANILRIGTGIFGLRNK